MPWHRCEGQKVTSWCPSLPPCWSRGSNLCGQPLRAEPSVCLKDIISSEPNASDIWTLFSGELLYGRLTDLKQGCEMTRHAQCLTRAEDMMLSPKPRRCARSWKIRKFESYVFTVPFCTIFCMSFQKEYISTTWKNRMEYIPLLLLKRTKGWPLLFRLRSSSPVYCLKTFLTLSHKRNDLILHYTVH